MTRKNNNRHSYKTRHYEITYDDEYTYVYDYYQLLFKPTFIVFQTKTFICQNIRL